MIYRLKRKTFGTKQISDLAQIETKKPIRDICYVDGFGIVFSTGNCLGLISEDGRCIFPWKSRETEDHEFMNNSDINSPLLGELSSVSYEPKNKLVIVGENGGRNIREIDLVENYTYSMFDGESISFMRKLLKNIPNEAFMHVASVCRGMVYIMQRDLSKCFFYNNSMFRHVAGDGGYRFTVGANAVNTSIGCPSGILFVDGKLYISDELNNIVRVVDRESISIYCGHPKTKILDRPSKIVVSKNIMFILCKKSIRTCIFSRGILNEQPVYESDRMISISVDKDGSLYIMEELYA